MIRIYQVAPTNSIKWPRYFFIDLITRTWSSDFDDIQQLVDVAYDDPELRSLEPDDDADSIDEFDDVTFLCEVESLSKLEEQFPELFI